MSEIKERPILFSAPMVRAILEGRKTVTRREVKCQPHSKADIGSYGLGQPFIRNPDVTKPNPECPYGRAGDRLWVRETFALLGNEDGCCIDWQDNLVKGDERGAARIYRASCPPGDYGLNQIPAKAEWKPDTEAMEYDGAWRPSIHMPRWASRILLEITDVRVERLQDITPEQVTAEGVSTRGEAMWGGQWWLDAPQQAIEDARKDFADLWTSTGGDWNANPWVWVVEFKRVTP
ncbi:morphogenetic protein [Pseudomonas extremaustralis]|uniref:Morphogenetic protein n=1 Tax=Pseudomonas extremaustralis TaxID=359110 RepID=A0A5C5QBN9_9PSED|nr:morphogenetic protein [Pseudomonas extremaustralis]EZI23344.1 morphogenetic protein [Pseudomonas extremaustralis 14-3 substr. 14-3b]TWS02860.1 morphogenetic protein [Pseudomonas extremaustralis]SDE69065.1 hypothetical protein SAMN05216591_0630 [Pseudomonas extremaustralis]SDG44612.1 hypothetical protein SAMN05216591_6105 [Pseudomonas extremaustralis]